MVLELYSNGSNTVWEHLLLDPSSHSSHLPHVLKHGPKKKPQAKDPLNPVKTDFIRAKYAMLSYVNRTDEDPLSLSDQLHSSVRTSNLKISLRLLATGADVNYFHPEKGTTPLHVAANSGHLLQIELLLALGADPLTKDSKGKTSYDVSFGHSFLKLAARLQSAPYDLTDRLSFFAFGSKGSPEQPIYLPPNDSDVSSEFLELASNRVFEEVARDLYDEVDRREVNQTITCDLSIRDKIQIPFLPVNPLFSSTRNQGRQKLATLNQSQLTSIIGGILIEANKRQMKHPVSHKPPVPSRPPVLPVMTSSFTQQTDRNGSPDSEPLYDSVPSSEDSDEEALSLTKLAKKFTKPHSKVASNGYRKSASHDQILSIKEYTNLQSQLHRSDHLVQELVSGNKDMRYEINRLQSMVQKLVDENLQLRNFVLVRPENSPQIMPGSPARTASPFGARKNTSSPRPLIQVAGDKILASPSRPPLPPAREDSGLGTLFSNHGLSSSDSNTRGDLFIHHQHHGGSPIGTLSQPIAAKILISSPEFPSKEEVFANTEIITKRIAELLSFAQDGKHEL